MVFTFRAVRSQAKRLPAVGGGYFEVGIGGREVGGKFASTLEVMLVV